MALTEERIRELEKAERKLAALEAAGVDNWDGYDFALESIRKEEEYDEFLDEVGGEIMDAVTECVNEPAGRGCGYGITDKGYQNVVDVLRKYKISRVSA